MSLNSKATAKILNDNLQPLLESKTEDAFISILESTLDNAFQEATTSLKNFLLTPSAGTLKFTLTDLNGTNVLTPENIGLGCSTYWLLAIGPGDAESCTTVTSVINDASKIALPISSELKALSKKSIDEVSEPNFYEMVDIIFKHVKTIIWEIGEIGPTCNTTLKGTVS